MTFPALFWAILLLLLLQGLDPSTGRSCGLLLTLGVRINLTESW